MLYYRCYMLNSHVITCFSHVFHVFTHSCYQISFLVLKTKTILVYLTILSVFKMNCNFFSFISQRMYHIVIFESTNEVEVVPQNWVRDNICMWPPYKNKDRVKAIKTMVKPRPSWTPYKIRIILTRGTAH